MSPPSDTAFYHRLLDLAVAVALVGAAAPLLEIFLPKPIRDRINAACYRLTDRLHDIRPAEFLQRWLRTSRRAHLGHVLFGIFTLIAIVAPPVVVGIWAFSDGFDWRSVELVLLVLFVQVLGWSQSTKVFDRIGSFVSKRLEQTQTLDSFLRTYVVFAMGGVVLIAATGVVAYWLRGFFTYGSFGFRVFQFAMNFYVGLVVTWIVMFLDGVLTLAVAALIVPLRALIAAARWFMRCVSAYSRGPLAALVTVFVTLLSALKAVMRW
jgi:hypothetical protein